MKQHIENLINFEIENNVITKRDYLYVRNQLYNLLGIIPNDDYLVPNPINTPADALNPILDNLIKNKQIEDSIIERDLFDSKIMNVFVNLPSVIQDKFDLLANNNKKTATSWFYNHSKAVNYIRTDRIEKNIAFEEKTKYGNLQITINLSKPEKDPKSIALAAKNQSSSYPKCVLCKENEGFAGNYQRDSRNQHRLINFKLFDNDWFFQFSPYIYYNEHAIVFSKEHVSMSIQNQTFKNLLELTDIFDGYFFGSNADLPIVGGSILSHEHYQGGNHIFPIQLANVLHEEHLNNIKIQLLEWPLSTVRLVSSDKSLISKYANKFLSYWKKYNNEELNIRAFTDETPHHTITPIARKNDNLYELDLILRDNQTSIEHPSGIFHPHEDKWNIKKENIGLIEAIGLAILPGRLKTELQSVKDYVLNNKELDNDAIKHKTWADKWKHKATSSNIDKLINIELAKTFEEILEDCGVFKQNSIGIKNFKKFINEVIEYEK
ncbi:UDP-glucose--hexose-1-phosphate uridylyltransferase [Haploplasma axanthum]|uniref:Galactose-1-phosphate uridylyltransferase n=1 Tax=Haploplasma axanthum TaxID=29552 RepID=A0A449BEK1_HAPAX|nr:UDP-glucose--hexose-1-phosphate uridylyltransferase [Haploplasma axanthum]VEU80884.1 galactose-1-phosphate uridylyltransferase [Haploplasma axanthum]